MESLADFGEDVEGNWEEDYESEVDEWKMEMKISMKTKQEIDAYQKELDGWLRVNQRAGSARQKFMEDPSSLTKHEAIELFGAISESLDDVSWIYEHLRRNPALLIGNSSRSVKRTSMESQPPRVKKIARSMDL